MRLQVLFFSLALTPFCFSQGEIQWNYSFNKEKSQLEFKADLKDGWHVYSQFVDMEFGPIPTSFEFESNNKVKLISNVKEPAPIVKYDETFETELAYFEKEVIFSQAVKVKKNVALSGELTYMVCNETMCLPPKDEVFTIIIDK